MSAFDRQFVHAVTKQVSNDYNFYYQVTDEVEKRIQNAVKHLRCNFLQKAPS